MLVKIAIVGAGFAGLAALKTLRELGHEATVFEKAPDVGGVWSRTRRYTGLQTQNNRDSYTFSDLRMPRDYPEWPSGEQVQAYLESYVDMFGLRPNLRLSTEVVRAELTDAEDGWLVTARRTGRAVGQAEEFDHLVVANGIFSDPSYPRYEGYADLVRAGGRLVAPSQLNDLETARDKNVLVVGYGKSACDIASSLAPIAASTRVVARNLPRRAPCGSVPTWRVPSLFPASRTGGATSPPVSCGPSSAPRGGTPAARASSRSRCTTSTRRSTTSG